MDFVKDIDVLSELVGFKLNVGSGYSRPFKVLSELVGFKHNLSVEVEGLCRPFYLN